MVTENSMDKVRQYNQRIPSHIFWGCCGSNALLDWPTMILITAPVFAVFAIAIWGVIVAMF